MAANTVASVFVRFDAKTQEAGRRIDFLARRLRSLSVTARLAGWSIVLSSGIAAIGIAGIGVAAAASALAVGALGIAGFAALMGLGAFAHFQAESVQNAFGELRDKVSNDLRSMVPEWEGTLVEFANRVSGAWDVIRDDLQVVLQESHRIFRRGMDAFFDGGGPEVFMSTFRESFENAVPFMERFADRLVDVTQGLGDFFTNMSEGFSADLADGFVGFFTDVLPALGELIGSLMELAETALPSVNGLLVDLLENLSGITDDLRTSGFVEDFFDGLSDGLNGFLNAVGALMGALGPGLGDVFRGLGDIFEALATPLSGIGEIFEILVDSLVDVIDAAGPVVGQLFTMFAGLLTGLSGPFSEFIEQIAPPFMEFLLALMEAVEPIIPEVAELVGAFLELATPVLIRALETMTDFIESNPKAIQSIASALLAIAVSARIIGLVMGFFEGLLVLAATLVSPLGWLGALLVGLAALFYHFYTTNEEFRERVDRAWTRVKEIVGDVVDWVERKVGDLIQWWEEDGAAMVASWADTWLEIYEEAEYWFEQVRLFLEDLWDKIVTFWNEHGDDIVGGWKEAWSQIWSTISTVLLVIWTVVRGWYAEFLVFWEEHGDTIKKIWGAVWWTLTKIFLIVSAVLSNLVQALFWGIETAFLVFQGLMTDDWDSLWDHLEETLRKFWATGVKMTIMQSIGMWAIIDWFVGMVGELWTTMKNTAISMIVSMWVGMLVETLIGIAKVMKFINNIPQLIREVFTGDNKPEDILQNVAARIMAGFAASLGANFWRVKDELTDLTSMLPSWKGPERVDRVLLAESGEMVMGGFIKGMQSQFGNIQGLLGDFTRDLNGSLAADLAGVMRGTPGPLSAQQARSESPSGASGASPTDAGGGITFRIENMNVGSANDSKKVSKELRKMSMRATYG